VRAETGDRKPESLNANPDFQRRTFDFGIRCIRLTETLPKTAGAQAIGKQLLRSATSVGANYRAAKRGRSRADFIAKMGIVEEECDESAYWIDVLVELRLVAPNLVQPLRDEANEIISITVSSIKTARRSSKA
jgi:four helix bundle protein